MLSAIWKEDWIVRSGSLAAPGIRLSMSPIARGEVLPGALSPLILPQCYQQRWQKYFMRIDGEGV